MHSALIHWWKHIRDQHSNKRKSISCIKQIIEREAVSKATNQKMSAKSRCALFLHNFSCIHVSKFIENMNTHEQELPDSQIGHKAHPWHSNHACGLTGIRIKKWLSTQSKSNSETATCLLLTGLTEGRRRRLDGWAGVWFTESSDCPSCSSNCFCWVPSNAESASAALGSSLRCR